jgi:hypothetical protein
MDQPEELERIAHRGKVFAEDAFGWDTIVAKLSEVYETAVQRRSARKIETGAKS